MKIIPLTQGKVAFVDDDDFERINQYKWFACKNYSNENYYVVRRIRLPNGKQIGQSMHRFILGVTDSAIQVDHINSNGLDNRKGNLRLANHVQNQQNRLPSKNNTSGFRGVAWHKTNKKFMARIKVGNKRIYLGYFSSAAEASMAYETKAREMFGEFYKDVYGYFS